MPAHLRPVLETVFEVYGLMCISQSLPFHMLHCGMTHEAAESVSVNLRSRVA